PSVARSRGRDGQAARHRLPRLDRGKGGDQQGLQGLSAARPVRREPARAVRLRHAASLCAAAAAGGRGARDRLQAAREGSLAHQEGPLGIALAAGLAYSLRNCREAHMVRPLLIALVLNAGAAAAAESLHLAPLGTVVSGSFDLAGKLIPLPAGNFALAAATVSEPPM